MGTLDFGRHPRFQLCLYLGDFGLSSDHSSPQGRIFSKINVEADYLLQDQVYNTAKFFYNYPLARLEQAPQDSYVTISYEDLVRQPGRVIQATYQRFGFEITPEFLQVLREEEDKIKSYKSRHVYSLDQFRFTREQIVSDLRHIFERFGFSAGQEKGTNKLL